MVIERLAQFSDSPLVIFKKMQQAWQEQGFEIVDSRDKERIIHCSGRSYSRIRVDVLTQCFDWQGETLVQMVYSPRLTPVVSRPVNISPAGQEKVQSDLERQMTSVLDQVGEWAPVVHEEVENSGVVLSDPYLVSIRRKGAMGRRSTFVGLAVAVLGALMGYLNLSGILSLGSSELWLVIAVAGVFVFCLGLFNLVWGR